ncbi:alpha/beta hydrolase [Amnibacterium endophyticum]|uniref:Alpha/beta hydrolase n=1 Tax=Amnibacterium endophyticum TaxID=2109337 RepID=A0ABW4LFH8_9MICO
MHPLTAVSAGPLDDLAGHRLLVLLHGLGADERDLLPLAPELALDDAVVSLRAPLPWGPGFAWAEVRDDPTRRTGSMRPAAEAVLAWLDGATAALGEPAEVRLLGFSQGGALALTLLRLAPERFASAVVLAGFVPEDDEDDAALAAVRPPVLWGRGDADPVIPAAAIDRTSGWLPAHSALTERVYPGLAHGISIEEIADVRAFLA